MYAYTAYLNTIMNHLFKMIDIKKALEMSAFFAHYSLCWRIDRVPILAPVT